MLVSSIRTPLNAEPTAKRLDGTWFRIVRVLLALAVFASALAVLLRVLDAILWSSFVASTAFAAIPLLATKRDMFRIAHEYLWCVLGVLVGLSLLSPIHPPYEPGDEYYYMIPGAIVGWLIGVITSRFD